MKTKFSGILTLFIVLVAQFTFAQQGSVTGTVTDENGMPLPGATVVIQGTSTGVSTDFDGKYSINANQGEILEFSYVGFKTITATVGASKVIDITLALDNTLDEVVVTALGIKRNAKDLSYAVTTLKSEEVTKTKSFNVATAMVGKVAGLQINTTNNGVNPSTRIVLRGNRSLLGNNQALVVVDGFPSDRGALDRINPNDIENISVLKGANAAALYGSDATNGVVLVTTKRGRGKLSVSYAGSTLVEDVAYLPEFQDDFGVGGFPDGTLYPLENVNWGPRYDGRLIDASETLNNGEVWQVPFSPIEDNHKNFFVTGSTTRHGITVSGGEENSSFLMSIDQTNTSGTVPNDRYNRTNFRLKGSKSYNNLSVGGNLSFYRAHTNVVGEGGRQDRPLYWNIINTPLHLPMEQLKNWRTGKFTRNETSYFAFYENPYFIADTQREKSDYNSFNVIAFADYKFTDWLSATLNVGYTFTGQTNKREFGALSYAFELDNVYSRIDPYGARTEDGSFNSSRFNSDLLLKFDKNLTEDINLKATVGQNIRIQDSREIEIGGGDLIIPDFYNISTRTGEASVFQETTNYRRVSFYGEATVGFKDFLYLTGTGRNDISSTLPQDENSFWYYGGGVSFVASNAFPGIVSENGISYLKTTFNYTKTGNDPTVYQTQGIFFAPDNFPYGSITGLAQSSTVPAPDLNPEFTTSLEAGMEIGLFNNRVRAELAVFKTNSTDQIIPVNTALSSGARRSVVNVGEIENKGAEVGINATVLRSDDFSWDLGVNWSPIKTEVISLTEGVNEVELGGFATAQVVATVGQPYPQLKTTAYLRDSQGRVIVGANGDPIQDTNNQIQGKTTPDYTVGLNTTINYKGFSLYAVADYRTGHVFYNGIVDAIEFTGLSKHSATSGRQPFVFPNSSYNTGTAADPVYVANTNRLTSGGGNAFWDTYNEVKENYVTDATTLKLREVSLSYTFNQDTLEKLGLDALTLSLFGRNLVTWRPADNVYTDPEFNFTTGNAVGVGTQSQTAPTRQFGASVNLTF
ncbi:SusC/RagA family TonB-linked outer membrane protein [Winogradskyella bathintestinalis]|uniref:SusC/RagA family TonB-linked outer membrane protein n=1 Tax=Winogradskyella bathintestinalis TaxID=3035208 RepID=A0ABT7ZUI1_9FLAO|nr:SusC/RagA family TonB-linked outer membrane protein [Winogradskyella bathintestinalis]MDN3492676.1 SusC/RagA family TonB-linked outer membrane protein [Winogradskyella bathintestinalis]